MEKVLELRLPIRINRLCGDTEIEGTGSAQLLAFLQ
jgi:hypothetical protein